MGSMKLAKSDFSAPCFSDDCGFCRNCCARAMNRLEPSEATESLQRANVLKKFMGVKRVNEELDDYNKSMKILEKRVKEILLGKKNELLWILEHNTVYTAGTSSQNKDLIDKSLKVIKTKRGGKHTLHSKGQKVIDFGFLKAQVADIQATIAKAPKGLYDTGGWDDFLRKE